MHDSDVTPARRQVGRRTVTRTAAWTVPAITLAVAAPAHAAVSGCKVTTGSLSWSGLKVAEGSDQRGKALATAGGTGVTVTVSTSGADTAGNNGIYTAGPIGGKTGLMLFHSLNNANNTTQTITVKFSSMVTNIGLSLLDVDSSQTTSNGTTVNNWEDLLVVGPTPFTGTKGSNVTGTGIAGTPYRAINKNSPIPDSGSTSNVGLSWAGPLDTITFVYSQDGTQVGSPKVGISDISFQRCV